MAYTYDTLSNSVYKIDLQKLSTPPPPLSSELFAISGFLSAVHSILHLPNAHTGECYAMPLMLARTPIN